jgi:uncharacterized protein YcbK (DUF882 family)
MRKIMRAVKKIVVAAGMMFLSFGTLAQESREKETVKKDTLDFYNLHTKETLKMIRADGEAATEEVNWFMRDFRRKTAADMDPALLDFLVEIKDEIRKRHPSLRVTFQVVSAYRAPETNDMLRGNGGSQAVKSLHSTSQAIDIRVAGLKTSALRDIATCINRGGVGYYESDDFVHIDTGRIRYWPSREYLNKLECK